MAEERKRDVNRFTFVGKIFSMNISDKASNVSFRVTRKAENGRTYTDTVNLVVLDEDAKEKFLSAPIRENIKVTGFIRSSRIEFDQYGRRIRPATRGDIERKAAEMKKEAAETGKKISQWDLPRYRAPQYFVATGAEPLDPKEEVSNEIQLTGQVEDTFVNSGGQIHFTIRTSGTGGTSRILAYYSPEKDENCLPIMRQRTRVDVKAHCVVRGNTTDTGSVIHDEVLIIDEIHEA